MTSIGQSIPQVDARDRVSGRIPFIVDAALPRMLHARILRSPHPHARIRSIDTERARRIPGVVTILTGADFRDGTGPKANYGRMFLDQDIVAIDKVRYVGDPVTAVAATSERAAAEAIAEIEVEYEPLPPVFSIRDALAPDAPLVHSPRPALRAQAASHVRDAGGERNLCSHFRVRRGDVTDGLDRAAHVRTDSFSTAAVQHVALEPHAVLADVTAGTVTVWTTAQMPHAIRAQLGETFGLPLTRVRVIVGPVGGAFGAKGGVKLEPLAAVLAWKSGRPVKLVLPRDEEFVTLTRHPSEIEITTGLTADGLIVSRRVVAYYNTGAYADVGPTVARNAGVILGGPYRIPNIEIDSYTVWTNLVPSGAFRGFGVPQACWAHESHMDALAEQVGIDPIELRSRNVLRDGDRHVTGEEVHDVRYEELLAGITRELGPFPAGPRPRGDGMPRDGAAPGGSVAIRRGKGIGLVMKGTITPSTSTSVLRLNADGSLNVLTASVDIGQGSKTALGQIAADAVGVRFDVVDVSDPDTQVSPFDQQTSSSRTTFSMGNAIAVAGADLKRQVLDLAADMLEVSPADLVTDDGAVRVVGSPDRSLSFAEIVARSKRGNLIAEGSFTTTGGLSLEDGQGIGAVHWHQGAAGCEVEVDLETGRISLQRLVVGAYVGRAINPRLCELQVEGSAIFGVGQSLFEQVVYVDGQVVNANLSEYAVPSARDLPPKFGTLILEGGQDADVHGIGETGLPPILPAIGNAVYAATGVRLTELPLSPERLLHELRDQVTTGTEGEP